jgi:hypothetical protein
MKAFVCEVDHAGLRRFLPEDSVPADGLSYYARTRFARPTTVAWALLEDRDAEAIRAEVAAGRTDAARGLLLNRAIELISLASAMPGPAHTV